MATSSLIPLLLLTSNFGEPPRSTFGFGNGFNNFGLQRSPYYPYPPRDFFPSPIFSDLNLFDDRYWPWKGFADLAQVNYLDRDGLNIVLNVDGYKPDEIEVRVITRQVVVRGKHEEEIEKPKEETENNNNNNNREVEKLPPSSNKVFRQFERRFVVPPNVDLDKVTTTISSDNILTIRAPFKDVPKEDEGKKINIEQTGKPAIKKTEVTKPQESGKKDEDTNEVQFDNKSEVSREPESREDDTNKESVEVKKEDKNAEENDIDGVSITTEPDDSTTPSK